MTKLEVFESVFSGRPVLSVLGGDLERRHLGSAGFGSVGSLLEQVGGAAPHLIVTYRHLRAWQWPHGLGEYLDVLTQATDIPVLVLPHPDAARALPHAVADTDRVMAIACKAVSSNSSAGLVIVTH